MPDSGFDENVFSEVFYIEEFVVHEWAACGVNPFQSVPHSWSVDRHARGICGIPRRSNCANCWFETFWSGLHARRPSGSSGACERRTSS